MTNTSLEALELLRKSYEATLASIEADGPFTSAVSYFWIPEEGPYGKMILLMSGLARHTKNILKNTKASFFVIESGSHFVYERKRVSVQGEIYPVKREQEQLIYKKKYLEIFPQAAMLFHLPDFSFYEFLIRELYFIGGFGKISSFK